MSKDKSPAADARDVKDAKDAKSPEETAKGDFAELFGRLESALTAAAGKKARVDDLTIKLASAQNDLRDAIAAVKVVQAEYQTRVGGVHPDLASGVSVSG